jgi:hypothetical protein
MGNESDLEIVSVQRFDQEELLGALRRTPLRGHDGVRPYAAATLELTPLATELLAPAQRYVLLPRVRSIMALRSGLFGRGIDLFGLQGGLRLRTSANPQETIPLTPPIVEESREPDGRTVLLVNDGLHRVFAARALGLTISVVLVRGVPEELPYYAYALPGGWSDVSEIEALPATYEKKSYRQPENYKALFREFNAVFPGIQAQREKSNPTHLRA